MNFPNPTLAPILIVDDSPDDAFLLRYRLRLGDIANPVFTFEDTLTALDHVHRALSLVSGALPELLFVDVKMTGGFDLVGRLREDALCDDTKIVAVTYSNDPADLQRALDLGIDGYLMKFPDVEFLARFVHRGPWFDLSRRARAKPQALCA